MLACVFLVRCTYNKPVNHPGLLILFMIIWHLLYQLWLSSSLPLFTSCRNITAGLTSSIILVRFTGVVITVAGGVFKNYCFHSRQWSFVTFWLVQHSENHMNCFVLWVSVWDHRRGNVHSQCGCMKGSTEGGICLVCICILASVLYVGRNGVRASDFFCSNINILVFFCCL